MHPPALQIEAILCVLTRHEVEFIVIGGFCLSAHGVIRATKDVDIVPAPGPENLLRLAGALHELHTEPMLADDFDPSELDVEPDAQGLALGGNWVLVADRGQLDVMQDEPGCATTRICGRRRSRCRCQRPDPACLRRSTT